MKPTTATVDSDTQNRWLQHVLNLLEVSEEQLRACGAAFELWDVGTLNKRKVYARDAIRPNTQRELGRARNYDPMRATHAVLIVKFNPEFAPEWHVMNGNNRVFLFGSSVTNPENNALPVIVFDSPEAYEKLLGADAWCGMGKARLFNFQH